MPLVQGENGKTVTVELVGDVCMFTLTSANPGGKCKCLMFANETSNTADIITDSEGKKVVDERELDFNVALVFYDSAQIDRVIDALSHLSEEMKRATERN